MKYLQPISIEKYDIYDILHNDNNELIIITPYINVKLNRATTCLFIYCIIY